MASRLVRANAVTVNDVLDGRKLPEIDCVDRVYLTLSVPNLVVGGQVVSFLNVHEQRPIPSPALLERRGQAFRRAVASFAEANDIPVLNFAGKRDKGRPGVLADSPWPDRKIDQVMPLMRKAAATGRSQVVAIGVAQEYQRVFTGTKDQTPTGAVWFSYNRTVLHSSSSGPRRTSPTFSVNSTLKAGVVLNTRGTDAVMTCDHTRGQANLSETTRRRDQIR